MRISVTGKKIIENLQAKSPSNGINDSFKTESGSSLYQKLFKSLSV